MIRTMNLIFISMVLNDFSCSELTVVISMTNFFKTTGACIMPDNKKEMHKENKSKKLISLVNQISNQVAI